MAKQQKKSFVFNLEWAEVLSGYPPEVRYEVYDAIIGYAQSGTLSEMKPLASMAFAFIRKEMDFNSARYDEISEIRRNAGRLGGAPEGNENATNKQKQAKTSKTTKNKQNKQNSINDNDNDNDIINNPPIIPPQNGREGVGFENYGSFENVLLKPAELRKLYMDFGEDQTAAALETFSCKLADGSVDSQNHYATLKYWLTYRNETGKKGKMETATDIERETKKLLEV